MQAKAKKGDFIELGLGYSERGNFDFDGDVLYDAGRQQNYQALQNWLLGHILALLVSAIGVKLMLIVIDGGANTILYWAAMKFFGPLMDGLRW